MGNTSSYRNVMEQSCFRGAMRGLVTQILIGPIGTFLKIRK